MKLSVFGATGRTGLQVVEKALAKGHEVTALARHPEILTERFPGIRVIPGDVFNLECAERAVTGSEAVISSLGFVGRSRETRIYSEGVVNVAKAMDEVGPRRLIVLAASQGIDPHPDFPWYASVMMKLLVQPMFGFAYRDMEKMTKKLAISEMDWTLVGVPLLTNRAGKGRYRSSIGSPLHHAFRISRADVADYLLSIIGETATFQKWTEVAW
jgi:putative NADH-flavin reductase